MSARMKNPALLFPDALQALQSLQGATYQGGVPSATLGLVHLRASQINGCDACIDMGTCYARKAGETDDRLSAVATWRDSLHFTPAERTALALTEAVTRLSDRTDPVPDELWNEVTGHYDEPARAALILAISLANVYNRLNVTTWQEAGSWEA